MLYGIDASHYQELIDWKKVKASGINFAILKASEGVGFEDPMFEQNVRGALENGILPGSYHFFLPRLDPIQQAKHYAAVLKASVGKRACLPPCVDLETTGLGKEGMNQALRLFLQEVEELTGRRGMIYTSPGFWSTYLPQPVLSQNRIIRSSTEWAAAHPLWLAHYTTGWPLQVYPWAGWTFWQYSSSGRIGGIATRVDLNLFNGSLDDLAALAVGTPA